VRRWGHQGVYGGLKGRARGRAVDDNAAVAITVLVQSSGRPTEATLAGGRSGNARPIPALCLPMSEEYDVAARRLVGNFPQAFSHVALVNSAFNLARTSKPAEQRAGEAAVAS
jgi:hypothetical protein